MGDVVDQAFAWVLERWPRVRTMDSPIGWTFTVARNLLRRSVKRSACDRSVEVTVNPTPEIDTALWDVVRSLPKRAAQLIVLRYVADLTEPEIATTLGIAKGTVGRVACTMPRGHLHSLLTPEEDPA